MDLGMEWKGRSYIQSKKGQGREVKHKEKGDRQAGKGPCLLIMSHPPCPSLLGGKGEALGQNGEKTCKKQCKETFLSDVHPGDV